MRKYTEAAQAVYAETRMALQTVYDELNLGQRQKLLKNAEVEKLLRHYGVTP